MAVSKLKAFVCDRYCWENERTGYRLGEQFVFCVSKRYKEFSVANVKEMNSNLKMNQTQENISWENIQWQQVYKTCSTLLVICIMHTS